jgi:hypothetical protein
MQSYSLIGHVDGEESSENLFGTHIFAIFPSLERWQPGDF